MCLYDTWLSKQINKWGRRDKSSRSTELQTMYMCIPPSRGWCVTAHPFPVGLYTDVLSESTVWKGGKKRDLIVEKPDKFSQVTKGNLIGDRHSAKHPTGTRQNRQGRHKQEVWETVAVERKLGNMMTKCDELSWVRSWNRRKTLGKQLRNRKKYMLC